MKTTTLFGLGAVLPHVPGVLAASDASYKLRYVAPAVRDFFAALPIGNGKLGAMVHGYTDKELIRFNEESIWSGGFIEGKIPPTAAENLDLIREQILNGSLTEAGETWSNHFVPDYDDMRRYQPAGELRIDFDHNINDTSDYQRVLDISNGLATVSYTHGNVSYAREAFGNFPHNVLGFKFSANQPGSLDFAVSLSRDQAVIHRSADDDSLSLSLQGSGTEDDTYRFASRAQIVLSDDVGEVTSNGTAFSISGANEAWVLYTVETAYKHPDATVDELDEIVIDRLNTALEETYSFLRDEAVSDYQQYYDRTSIDLGTSDDMGQEPIPVRRNNWQRGNNLTSDVEFLSLTFNFGKYLLIQSSRPGTLPANLQGIWNHVYNPPWDSKFTLNVNLEMNYWFAQPLDLPEVASPIIDFLDKLSVTGREVAKGYYGLDGVACHHNTDITGDCTPFHGLTIAAPYPLGAAWVAFEIIEYFRFTRDEDIARTRILPILEGLMEFIYNYATERDGYWITNPSCSPENSYYIPEGMTVAGENTGIDAGAMNDRAIMWEIMQGWVEISEALGLTEGVQRAKDFRDKIQGPVAGSFGQMLEYSRDYRENQPGHRHFSPFVGVQPGSWTSPLKTPEDAEKAYILLRHRMDNGGGGNSWAVTWASLLHARLLDAPHALQYAMELPNRWVHENMFSRNGGYFQIDGNSGLTASLVEMFLQSHAGVVHLGPSIPAAGLGLSSGSFKGWVARGGFKVDLDWAEGVVTKAEITSTLGNPLKIRVGDGVPFTVNGKNASCTIRTEVGEKYSLEV